MGDARRYVAYVTAPSSDAERLARVIVERRVAACVNIVPQIRSIYRWQGEICNDGEALLVIKTTAARLEQLEALVVELHPYEVPEIVAMPIVAGHQPYLQWIDDSTSDVPED